MKATIKILYPEKVKKDILKAIYRHTRNNFKRYAAQLQTNIAGSLTTAMQASPTMKSLESGPLREELGLESVNTMSIITAVASASNLNVSIPKIVGNQIVGNIKLEAAPLDLETLTSGHEDGIQVTEKGQELPWLEWLTTLGDAVIVRDFEVRAGFPNVSRTGDKIMIKGRGWRVPPEHAGSQEDNFLTRAVDESLPEIEKDIIYYFKSAIGV